MKTNNMNVKIEALSLPLSHLQLMVNFMADNCVREAQMYFDMEPLRDRKAFQNMTI